MTRAGSSRDFLFSLEFIGIKLGLEQIRALLSALDHPDRAYRSIVVAGTNGKGSVTAMLERGLRAAGYRTGRYTSPHLVHLEERVAIDGTPISPDTLERAAARVQSAAAALPHPPSFFEATTALALDVFRESAVEIAVLEVGLGGRLDATNAVSPIGVAITAIDLDHQQYLGDTIEQIAVEKAGVIKPGIVAVLGANPPAVRAVIRDACDARGARYVYAPDGVTVAPRVVDGLTRLSCLVTPRGTLGNVTPRGTLGNVTPRGTMGNVTPRGTMGDVTPRGTMGDVTLGLCGRHQVDNAVVALRLLEELDANGIAPTSPEARRAGLEQVEWPGRLEWRESRGQPILIDGAHNPAGARALASYVHDAIGRPVPLVVAVMADKDIDGILAALLPLASHVVCTAAATPRAAAPQTLASRVRALAPHLPVMTEADSAAALARARTLGSPIVIAGSLFLAGEIRSQLS